MYYNKIKKLNDKGVELKRLPRIIIGAILLLFARIIIGAILWLFALI